jgi:S1-C subfamily serine protease
VLGVALGASLLGGLVAGGTVAFFSQDDAQPTTQTPGQGTASAGTLSVQQTSAITDVAAKARPGVVRVESTRRTQNGVEQDVGSGIVLDTEGHVLTNAHVVLNTDSLKIVLSDGTERPAILVGNDFPFTDLAVLQIGPGKLTPIEPGDSSALVLGESVIAIGNPLAEFDGSVTVGVISGLNRTRVMDDVRQDDLIQTDAAVNNGNSGGALLNLRGQFIGIPTAVLRQTRSGLPVEGIAFALPSNRVMEIAKRIIAEGSYPRPSFGADLRDLTAELLARTSRPAATEGAIVALVTAGGAADVAGIQAGDIITKLAGQDVNRDNPFLNVLMRHQPGETVRVVLNRNGRIIEADVRLSKRG